MNEWPEDLWQAERHLTRSAILSANDADAEDDSPYTTGSTDLLEAAGMLLTLSCFVVTALLAATVGSLLTRSKLRQKAIT